MRLGIELRGDPAVANRETLALLVDSGLQAVFLAVEEAQQDLWGLELAEFARACRREGLAVVAMPRGYGLVAAAEPDTASPYLHAAPQVWQIDNRGRRVQRACPNHPEFLAWFERRMHDLSEMLACDGVLWDGPGFYYARGSWACRCEYCQRGFWVAYEQEMPVELGHQALHFQQQSVLLLLMAGAAAAKRVNPSAVGMVVATPWLAHEQAHMETTYFQQLLGSAAVDVLVVAADWQGMHMGMEDCLSHLVRAATREATPYGKPVCLRVAGSPDPADRLMEAVRFAAHVGCDRLILRDYDSVLGDRAGAGFEEALKRLAREVAGGET